MKPIRHDLLDMGGLEMLRRMRMTALKSAEGTFSGPHRSNYRGSSVEFADYRDYVDGDDIRLVDWKAFSRSDRYYIRLFESERNLLSFAVVDCSASMAYRGAVQRTDTKFKYAARVLAALGYLIIQNGDEIGLALVNDDVVTHQPPGRSWPHFVRFLDSLNDASPDGPTRLGRCLESVFAQIRRRGLLFVFSDFLEPEKDLWRVIGRFRQSDFQVILFHLLHPEELDLPDLAVAKFADPEGTPAAFKVAPELVRGLYRDRMQRFLRQTEANAVSRGCRWVPTRTDVHPYQFLRERMV
jgi:uncharacterized protein (DUF58 family)